jgi:ABC-type sugar transport system permease subunit
MFNQILPRAGSPKPRRRNAELLWIYLFVAPMIILTLTFTWYPMAASLRYAFYNWRGFGEPTQFVGLRHFVTVINDPYFWGAIGNSLIYTLVQVPIQLLLALILALVLNNPKLRFAGIFRAIFFIPVVCSIAVLAVPMRSLFTVLSASVPQALVDVGIFDRALGFLGSPNLAMPSVIAVGVWSTFGYNLVFFLAALQSVPRDVYEAATVDGAGPWTKFWHITLPLIQPVGVVILFLALLGSMRVFELVLVLTNGGPFYATEVAATYIYSYAFTSKYGAGTANLGYASAASLVMNLLLLVLVVVQVLTVNRARRQRADLGLE